MGNTCDMDCIAMIHAKMSHLQGTWGDTVPTCDMAHCNVTNGSKGTHIYPESYKMTAAAGLTSSSDLPCVPFQLPPVN